jgi:hypothetical protein
MVHCLMCGCGRGNVVGLFRLLAAGMESPSLQYSNDLCRFARFEKLRPREESLGYRESVR